MCFLVCRNAYFDFRKNASEKPRRSPVPTVGAEILLALEFSFGAGPCFFQAEDGIRDSVASRGLGDVYKRQMCVFWRVDTSILILEKARPNRTTDRYIRRLQFH